MKHFFSMDARVKPGHDVWRTTATAFRWVGSADAEAGLSLEISMIAIRAAKAATVAAIALFASLVTFGNLTDYNTNFVFVEHVLSMDSIFPFSTIKYRAITSPALHHAAYDLIIAVEAVIALLCWIGAVALVRRLRADAAAFNRAKTFAVLGLTLGFLLWQ